MFEQLDYIYHPSRDVAADVAYFVDRLGARLVFAIEGMGTRVAMVELADGAPQIVLAGHLEGDHPILVYRVPDLDVATRELKTLGADLGHALEIRRAPSARSSPPAASASRSTSWLAPASSTASPAGATSDMLAL